MVGRDDDDDSVSAGSEVSEAAASWETVDDDERDTHDYTQEVCIHLNCSMPLLNAMVTTIVMGNQGNI